VSGGAIRFVADLGADDPKVSLIFQTFQWSNATVSSDGEQLTFLAIPRPRLTSDPISPQCEAIGGTNCRELYLYDDATRSIECVSCLHGGETTSEVEAHSTESRPDYAISGDGSTLAFVTDSRLLRRDVNDSRDLYEWRNGAIHLVTDGVTTFAESFTGGMAVRGISSDGSDIFYKLTDPGRTGFEQDGFANLYDARIGGGWLPPAPPVHCSEEACQGPLQSPPAPEASGSDNATAGNVAPAAAKHKRHRRCAKKHGKAKRRCLHRHHHKRHKRHASAKPHAGATR
jgi:hypothetical protein